MAVVVALTPLAMSVCSVAQPTVLTTTGGVSVTLPAGAVVVQDPDHDVAFDAEFIAGRRFRVTIDPFPAARTDLFPEVADYGRITEERVTVMTEAFTNPQGFDVEIRQFRGASGDFNLLTALASRPNRAVLVRLEAPDIVLDSAAADELKNGFRSVCASLSIASI